MFNQKLLEWCQQNKLHGEARLLRHLLEFRFGALPVWADQQLATATEEKLIRWGQAMLGSTLSLEQLLRT